jgi:hypothetical protein
MLRVPIFVFSMASAGAQFVTPVPSVMPSWMVPYPGAFAANRQTGNAVESTYKVAAPPHDVLAHFRTLFASAGLGFRPDPMGGGFLVRTAAPECDLEVSIRRHDSDTDVKVTCSPRLEATERISNEHAQARAAQDKSDGMKKFDTPVYPQAKGAVTPLAWPSWLVRVDGVKLPIEKLAGQLKSSFMSTPTREGIQAFYAGLLDAHHFRVTEGLAAAPEKFGSWVQATAGPDSELGRNVVIRIKIRPAGENFTVDITLQ